MAAPEVATASEKAFDDDRLRLDRQICFPLYAATNLI